MSALSPLRRHLPLLAFWLLCMGAVPASAQERGGGTVVYLVRHAEKASEPVDDPPLTGAGRARAEELARMLGDAGIGAVWSTDFARTRSTAAPLATAAGLAPELYDPDDLEALAGTLRARGGRVLVVGHSNTTPALVRALGGEPGTPISGDEYDRLYVVLIPAAGPVDTLLLRFGAPSDG